MGPKTKEIEKIDVLYCNCKGVALFIGCVGSQEQIKLMHSYIHFQKEQQGPFNIMGFINRAIAHGTYCYVEGNNLFGKLIAVFINKKIGKSGNRIGETMWNEAMILKFPEGIRQIMEKTKEEVKELQKKSAWLEKFDYEKDW